MFKNYFNYFLLGTIFYAFIGIEGLKNSHILWKAEGKKKNGGNKKRQAKTKRKE